jgi:serine/threonine protein kinase
MIFFYYSFFIVTTCLTRLAQQQQQLQQQQNINQDFIIELKFLNKPLLNNQNQLWSNRFYLPTKKEKFSNASDFMLPFKRRMLNYYNYEIEHELGRGNFGVVYKGTHKQTNVRVAIKVASADSTTRYFKYRSGTSCYLNRYQPQCDTDLSDLMTIESASLLKGQGIKGVIKLEGFGILVRKYDAKLRYFITIMELLPASKPLDNFKKTCIDHFPTNEARLFFLQNVLNHLYNTNEALLKRGIYHNDIKADNILIQIYPRNKNYSNNNIKKSVDKKMIFKCSGFESTDYLLDYEFVPHLIDFGNAVIYKATNSNNNFMITRTSMNTIYNPIAAPELQQLRLQKRDYIDIRQLLVWYEGTLAFELCLEPKYSLFDFNKFILYLKSNNENVFNVFLKKCSNDRQKLFNRFLRKALNNEPTKRFSYEKFRQEIALLSRLNYNSNSLSISKKIRNSI